MKDEQVSSIKKWIIGGSIVAILALTSLGVGLGVGLRVSKAVVRAHASPLHGDSTAGRGVACGVVLYVSAHNVYAAPTGRRTGPRPLPLFSPHALMARLRLLQVGPPTASGGLMARKLSLRPFLALLRQSSWLQTIRVRARIDRLCRRALVCAWPLPAGIVNDCFITCIICWKFMRVCLVLLPGGCEACTDHPRCPTQHSKASTTSCKACSIVHND
jgi:hypothetical protein